MSQESTKVLCESLKILTETEDVAKDTIVHLQQQGQVINKSRNNVKETNAQTNLASRLVTKMLKWWRS